MSASIPFRLPKMSGGYMEGDISRYVAVVIVEVAFSQDVGAIYVTYIPRSQCFKGIVSKVVYRPMDRKI